MSDTLLAFFDSHPVPATTAVPIGPGQLERIDENLDLAWGWYRYRSCRPALPRQPRILDAGCGTGLSTLALARLHPDAHVVGLDFAPAALDLARQRLAAASETVAPDRVQFLAHDLAQPLPGTLGPFDSIVCQQVLHLLDDPATLLRHLAACASPRALLLVTMPGRGMRLAARQLRTALHALAPDAPLDDQAQLGATLFQTLRPDHPLRQFEAQVSGPHGPSPERLLTAYLAPGQHDLALDDLVRLLEGAGWQFLYEASPTPWQPERIFHAAAPADLERRVATASDAGRALLMEALDPSRSLREHQAYACLATHEPRVPAWPDQVATHPEQIDALVPRRTGLVARIAPAGDPAGLPGVAPAALYRAVNGSGGPVDPVLDACWLAADGSTTCGAITDEVRARTGLAEPPELSRARWLEMANRGFVYLEPPETRQHVDCTHLGPIRDRLDCPCPRRWIRGCEIHHVCSIDQVHPDDPAYPAFLRAVESLDRQVGTVVACETCADYAPDE